MKKYLPLLLSLFVFSACDMFKKSDSSNDGFTNIDTAAASQMLTENQNNPDFAILDVRTASEVAQGQVAGAMNIDFNSEGFASQLEGLDHNKTYLVYCQSGGRSAMAATKMVSMGFTKVFNLSSGVSGGIPIAAQMDAAPAEMSHDMNMEAAPSENATETAPEPAHAE